MMKKFDTAQEEKHQSQGSPSNTDPWAIDSGSEAAWPEAPPRTLPVDADFLDIEVMPREDYERFVAEGWQFDVFDGGFSFEDVIAALEEFKSRTGNLDVHVDFVVPVAEDVVEEDE